MAQGQSPALSPDTAERYRRVVQMRAAGVTFDRIANELGYASRSGAKEAYDTALRSWGREAVDDLRVLEGERIDELWRRLFTRMLEEGEQEEPLEVHDFVNLISTAVRLSKRRSELFGLDAPRQHMITGPEGGPIELVTDIGELLKERLDEIAARSQPKDAPHAIAD
jgi:sulfite reductase alpha subunit-like flavoprotein